MSKGYKTVLLEDVTVNAERISAQCCQICGVLVGDTELHDQTHDAVEELPQSSSIVELWEAKDLKWYFHKKSANGSITEPSQGYASKSSARKAAKRDIPGIDIVEV